MTIGGTRAVNLLSESVHQRSRTETDDVPTPKPDDSGDDAEKRQEYPEDEEGFAARDRPSEPIEVHPEKPGERGDRKEDQGLWWLVVVSLKIPLVCQSPDR
jgi:hypothetical protein